MPQVTLKLVDDSIQIGDRVYCTMYGFGVVIDYNLEYEYPIGIKFDSRSSTDIYNYTTTAKYIHYSQPTLYRIPGSTNSKDITVTVTLNIE